MIRYLTNEHVYYSLHDVSKWLYQQAVLTKEQSQLFSFSCKAYMAQKLANAYQEQHVLAHLEPIILPTHDYFIHWIVWANLLMLLPGSTGCSPKVHELNLVLDNPDTVYLWSLKKPRIKLVSLDHKLKLVN